ncbi:KN motif and ankyrin repeat domain-containing protein 2-like isoform X2 [Coccinella septempunctata]|uniref:KN motif and ankyrin repeat domain-containing protein 2-like isoform X2 n=1 Tax=Coccinella septempunctata TaxID=41139 RepID=UPI001D082640|nr:KN motif and ankyrin repeat domain-containing protein 2-like isoform X2 [Coccinella septempunctata]
MILFIEIQKQPEPISPILETENRLLQKQDSFDNVIDDFEKTFQRSNVKLSHNLPDVTAVSDIRSPVPSEVRSALTGRLVLKKTPQRELESSSELCALTPRAFKAIREQMALSLERTRQLEEQIKQLPALKIQISTLEDEKERLLQTIDNLQQNSDQIGITKKFATLDPTSTRRNRSSSFSCTDNQYDRGFKRKCQTPSTKEMGVSCSVLTRNVGVGNQTLSRRHASTSTDIDAVNYADKWFGEKLKFMNDQNEKVKRKSMTKIPMINKANQTFTINSHNQETQTPKSQIKTKNDKYIQTVQRIVAKRDQATVVKPKTIDFGIQKSIESYNIGVSDDTITDINCDKCEAVKISVGVGPEIKEDQYVAPISLASLSFPRSKSFNLGEDKMDFSRRKRSISVQYQYKPDISTKGSQYEPSNVSRSCQSSIKTHSKGTQYESNNMDSSTQFDETFVVESTPKKDSHKVETQTVGCNTSWESPAINICSECRERRKDHKEFSKTETSQKENLKVEDRKKEESKKKDGVVVSRIPKPQLTPTSERRKFRRQDTYTKINASPPPEEYDAELSGLDLSKSSTSINALERVKEKLKFPEIPSESISHNDINHQSVSNLCHPPIDREPIPSTPSLASIHSIHRKKAMPSKEMQGAMKVLNDSLQKQSKLPNNHRAIDIIQQEWFKISGVDTANPLDVEDYLDAFEDMSSMLLDCIVNMTDASGNTAMHYAVSHGNFDVVSILLDSKVCDINKPNKAGYTSVMLVSLAEICSQTHANVVRRLFQMADVNQRAKQHGQTALMLAVSHGKLDMVKMLLEAGADINIQDDDGSTALMCAAEHGHIEIVKHFLSQPDCDSTITDVDGSTALKIAMEAEHRPIGVLLYAHERNLMVAHGHKHKKKSTSPKPPSSPLSIRHSHSALNNIKSSK